MRSLEKKMFLRFRLLGAPSLLAYDFPSGWRPLQPEGTRMKKKKLKLGRNISSHKRCALDSSSSSVEKKEKGRAPRGILSKNESLGRKCPAGLNSEVWNASLPPPPHLSDGGETTATRTMGEAHAQSFFFSQVPFRLVDKGKKIYIRAHIGGCCPLSLLSFSPPLDRPF